MQCEMCKDTGFVGDRGPGIKGNNEFYPCECGIKKCIHIKGYLVPDDLDRCVLVYYPERWKKEYFVPFQFCPLCGEFLKEVK